MKDIQVSNKLLWFNLFLGLLIVMGIRFIFKDDFKSPVRYLKKFPIHLPS